MLALGDDASRDNPEDADRGHPQTEADVELVLYYANPPAITDERERYVDAVNFLTGVLDDLWHLHHKDCWEHGGRPTLYPLQLLSTRRAIAPGLDEEQRADDDGGLSVTVSDVWSTAFLLRLGEYQGLAERKA